MILRELVERVEDARVLGDDGVDVRGITADSREVAPGTAFVAVRGTRVDGHAFLADAVERGAVALVVEAEPRGLDATVVVVPDTRRALARMASRWHGDPGDRLLLCGATGTNGKTTTTWMTRAMVSESPVGRMGIVGTLGWGCDALEPTTHTTPDAPALHGMLAQMESSGCVGVVMEVSSHAVRQHRAYGLEFAVGIVTNVGHDHLDYHPDWNDYFETKRRFAMSLADPGRRRPPGTLVYWRDDDAARRIGEAYAGPRVSVGESDDADVRVETLSRDLGGTRLRLRTPRGTFEARTRMTGAFVATNAALAAAAALELGADPQSVSRALEAMPGVPGRFETFGGGDRPTAVVDYAHTPGAVARVLDTCRELGARRVSVVFGCGGERDRTKRGPMGEAAATRADRVFVTTDNPRGEPLERIVEDIVSGMSRRDHVSIEPDRTRAIRTALAELEPGDVVAVLGKGHETYQEIAGRREPYSDRDAVTAALDAWKAPS